MCNCVLYDIIVSTASNINVHIMFIKISSLLLEPHTVPDSYYVFLQDVMEEWAICQKSWLYLEPIFSSDDIMRQLPVEGKRYQTMDRMWRKVMLAAKQDPKVSIEDQCYDDLSIYGLRVLEWL